MSNSVFICPTQSEVVDLFHITFDLGKDSSALELKVSCIHTTGLLSCEYQHNKTDNRKQKQTREKMKISLKIHIFAR